MAETSKTDLRTAVIDAAFDVIAAKGVENLSLREVARQLGVSHQAPYKHFPSRNHILAAVVAKCFEEFAATLEARPGSDDPFEDLARMGLAYLDFAKKEPLKYRLMFNTPLPDGADHPDMLARGQYAFHLLCAKLGSLPLRPVEQDISDATKHDAMFVWSALHGFASLMHSDVTVRLGMGEAEERVAVERIMRRLSLALEPGP